MARFSELDNSNNAIPENYYEDLHTCLFCGESFTRGGSWAGCTHYIGICEECVDQLMALMLDTLRDTMNLSSLSDEEQVEYIKNIAVNRILKDKARTIVPPKRA